MRSYRTIMNHHASLPDRLFRNSPFFVEYDLSPDLTLLLDYQFEGGMMQQPCALLYIQLNRVKLCFFKNFNTTLASFIRNITASTTFDTKSKTTSIYSIRWREWPHEVHPPNVKYLNLQNDVQRHLMFTGNWPHTFTLITTFHITCIISK